MPPLPPSWDAYHPLVVHFPIALFVVAPIFILLGAITGMRALMLSALILLVLGTAGAFVATNTGEEAYDVMEPDEALDEEGESWDVVELHYEQTEFARNIFVGVTAVYAVVVALAYALPSSTKLVPRLVIGLVMLGLAGYGNMVMANGAHLGGELVHRYGVRAAVAIEEETAETADEESGAEEADSDAEEDEPAEAESDEAA
ncbi:MAG: DUF2231 domain-containing protein [Planctomycetota bacterium]